LVTDLKPLFEMRPVIAEEGARVRDRLSVRLIHDRVKALAKAFASIVQ